MAGPAVDVRVCLVADGLEGDDQEDAAAETSKIAEYFWGGGRWMQTMAGFGFDFPFTENTTLGVEFRSWFPIYSLWTGETLPFIENLRFALGLTLVFR
jgi:hypothetical protein